MAFKKCPGMDPANFKPADIKQNGCVSCGYVLEFWKDDVKVKCPSCKQVNFNPNLGSSCITWCKMAADCVGNNDVLEWIARNKDKPGKNPC